MLIAIIACIDILGEYGITYPYSSRYLVTTVLSSTQIIAASIVTAAIMSVNRRPDVFSPDGQLIDRQMNVNLWSRYAFNWAGDILALSTKEALENTSLPAMDNRVRSEDVTEGFTNMILKDTVSLWVQIFWHFRNQFIYQWAFILLSNFFDVAPAFATLKLLQFLETRKDLDDIDPMAWKYVAGIVIATVSSHLVDSRISWFGMSCMLIYNLVVCKLIFGVQILSFP